MKHMIGYFGIVLILLALIALAVDQAKKKKQTESKPEKKAPKQKKVKSEKKKQKKEKNKDSGRNSFAIPGQDASAPAVPETPAAPVQPAAPVMPASKPDRPVVEGGTVIMEPERGRDASATVLLDEESPIACAEHIPVLRGNGSIGLPANIQVVFHGEEFTVGRTDVVLGHAQSDFEFPAETKAVSRRHAAFSRDQEGYIIQDLGSKAGTFVNGVRLEPQQLYRLEDGCSISFGNAGADYIWEE